MTNDPKRTAAAWLPHLLMLALVAAAAWLLLRVYLPLFEPILLAASLALLTAPIVSRPLTTMIRQAVPRLPTRFRRQLVGVIAALIIVAVIAAPVVVLLLTTTGSIGDVVDLAVGVITHEEAQIERLRSILADQVRQLHRIYPRLGLDEAGIPDRVVGLVREARGFGPSVLGFLFRGTGRIAELALALISLAFFVAEGPRLVEALLRFSPLEEAQHRLLVERHRHIVLRLIADTVATAVTKGLVLGTVAWLVGRAIGFDRFGLPLISALGAFVSLLPLVGVAIVWLPLAVILWTAGHPAAAIVLAVASLAGTAAVDLARRRIFRDFDHRGSWISFLLFLSLIGGILTFGLAGFVIGPTAVVLVYGLGSLSLPVYGIGDEPGPRGQPPPASSSTSNSQSSNQ
jgi:predicted PurR-regulated permease PerM